MPTWMARGPGSDWHTAMASRISSFVTHFRSWTSSRSIGRRARRGRRTRASPATGSRGPGRGFVRGDQSWPVPSTSLNLPTAGRPVGGSFSRYYGRSFNPVHPSLGMAQNWRATCSSAAAPEAPS
jgi:hypothetical protein